MKYIKRSKRRFLKSLPRKKQYGLSIFRIFLFLLPPIIWLFIALYFIIIENRTSPAAIFTLILMWLVQSPNILLTINYLMKSRIKKVVFDVEREMMRIVENGVEVDIRYDEIKKIELITARNAKTYYHLRSVSVPWFFFEYSILYLSNEKKRVVTCFVMNQLNLIYFLCQIKHSEIDSRFPMIV